jgi:hypothetical protein
MVANNKQDKGKKSSPQESIELMEIRGKPKKPSIQAKLVKSYRSLGANEQRLRGLVKDVARGQEEDGPTQSDFNWDNKDFALMASLYNQKKYNFVAEGIVKNAALLNAMLNYLLGIHDQKSALILLDKLPRDQKLTPDMQELFRQIVAERTGVKDKKVAMQIAAYLIDPQASKTKEPTLLSDKRYLQHLAHLCFSHSFIASTIYGNRKVAAKLMKKDPSLALIFLSIEYKEAKSKSVANNSKQKQEEKKLDKKILRAMQKCGNADCFLVISELSKNNPSFFFRMVMSKPATKENKAFQKFYSVITAGLNTANLLGSSESDHARKEYAKLKKMFSNFSEHTGKSIQAVVEVTCGSQGWQIFSTTTE